MKEGRSLSAGERQLLAFARALYLNPKILVLDEATSHVDPETEWLIREGLERLLKGRTAIVIAHRLSTIQHADRIVVLHKGRVREIGTHDELMAKAGFYAKLYQLQNGKAKNTERRRMHKLGKTERFFTSPSNIIWSTKSFHGIDFTKERGYL